MAPPKPSSSNEGFFQSSPTVQSQFHDDASFRRILDYRFANKVLSKQILDWVGDAERNVPYLKGGGRDVFGKKTSVLAVGEGWRRLQEFGISSGVVADGYNVQYGEYSRIVQHLKSHLWTGSCANVTRPSAMTDGAAKLLAKHITTRDLDANTKSSFEDAYVRLTSRNPKQAWTSGQWMTERSGGSDVSGTETIATHSPDEKAANLGPWSIDGFKWFSSATDSSMAILLAQTTKGLSTFLAPARLPNDDANSESQLNGISIQRLKNKFGTKSLPTAELELVGTRAQLIGEEGNGIFEISTILNISRLWSAVSATGYLGRGLAIARAYAQVRKVGAGRGKRVLLKDNTLHMNTLAKITGDYHAMMLFVFFIAWLVGIEEHAATQTSVPVSHANSRLRPEGFSDVALLLRVLTSVLKATVCKRSIHGLQECMEALGGVGYLDNVENESLNIARLYRDCCVLSIWEGTTDVLASDTIRVLKGRQGEDVLAALGKWVSKGLGDLEGERGKEKNAILQAWAELEKTFISVSADNLLPQARDLVFRLGDIVMGVLLVADTENASDFLISTLTSRFLKKAGLLKENTTFGAVREGLQLNQQIVFGGSGASRPGTSKL